MDGDGESSVEREDGEFIPYKELPESFKNLKFEKKWWDELSKEEQDEIMNYQHPADDPRFDAHSEEPVWYLSHPLAPDDKYTLQQNMDHIVHLIALFYREGWKVVAPYHTVVMAIEDEDMRYRIMGLEADCWLTRKCGWVILAGHRASRGMNLEMEAAMQCPTGGMIRNFIGYSDQQLIDIIRNLNDIAIDLQ